MWVFSSSIALKRQRRSFDEDNNNIYERFFTRGTQLRMVRYNETESTTIIENIKLKNNPTAQYIKVSRRLVVSESN